jgi:hypothetical protein
VNGFVHENYSPLRNTVSELAIGPGGWIQIANFVVTGCLMTAFAVGLHRTMSRGRAMAPVPGDRVGGSERAFVAGDRAGWGPRLVALYGLSLIVVGVFVSDPVAGLSTTVHGNVHLLVSLVVFGALTAACFVLGRRFPERSWRVYSRVVGVVVPVFFIAMGAGPAAYSGLLQRVAILAGWTWIAAVSVRMSRLSARSARLTAEGSPAAHPASGAERPPETFLANAELHRDA